MSDKSIEIAKSWFVLAEIFAILSGLFIFSSGFILTPERTIDAIDKVLNICEKVIQEHRADFPNITLSDCMDEFGKDYFAAMEKISNSATFFMFISLIFMADAVFFWMLGKYKLKNKQARDESMAIVIAIISILTVSYLWLKY